MNLGKLLPKIELEQSEDKLPPGRKFLFGRYGLLLATLGYLATALSGALSANFAIFVGALATLYTIYCGGNVGNKWVQKPVNTKVILDRRKKEPEPEEEPKPEDGPGKAGD